jgi:hypothetical protein
VEYNVCSTLSPRMRCPYLLLTGPADQIGAEGQRR